MMEFEALRKKYQHALYQLIKLAHSASGNENPLYNPRYILCVLIVLYIYKFCTVHAHVCVYSNSRYIFMHTIIQH